MRKVVWLVLLAAVAAAGAYSWQQGFGLTTAVRAVEVGRGAAAEIVYATGVVEPQRWAKVVALQRKRIVWICDCEGKPVSMGDPLVRLDNFEERALLSEFEARRNRIALDIERITKLVARNAATQTSLDQLITQLQEYDARIAAQKDRIHDLELRAPLDGVVLRKDGEVGEIAGTGANDILFWIGPPKPLHIVAEVSEDDIPRVRTGQRVLLRSEGFKDQAIEAKVGDITPKGDPATKTFRVYLTLPDDTPLRIGMSVEANVVTREKANAVLAPAEAIIDNHAFAVRGDRLVRLPVQIGIRGTRMLEVLSGIQPGEKIVSPATSRLRDGMRIAIETGPDAPDAPGAPGAQGKGPAR